MKIKSLGNDGKGSLLRDKSGYLKATITINGKQLQKRVKNEDEALQWVLQMQLDRTDRDELSAKQLNDVANALHFLKQKNIQVSFLDMARYYADNAYEGVVSVADAVSEYLEKSKARVAEGTLRGYSRIVGHFSEIFGERKVASIKRKDMIDYLSRFEQKPPQWLNVQRALSKFFVECEKYGYCSSNPCSHLDAPRNLKAPDRKYLSVEDAEKLMRYAEANAKHLVVYFALGLFGGLRPSEAQRMTAKHINLKTGYLHISADITKTHSFKERTFQIEPTLMAWLRKYYDPKTKPVPYVDENSLNYAVAQTFKKSGVPKSNDVLRHSYGTYRFALTGNSAETASVMGHNESVGLKYYRGRAPKEEAIRFFAIRPQDEVLTGLDAL